MSELHASVAGQPVVLRLEGVSKVYSGTVAVKHADFEVRSGAVNVLVGENGAGKSTLVKMIAGVEQPTAGKNPARRRSGAFQGYRRRDGAWNRHGLPGTEPIRQPFRRGEHLRQPRDHAPRTDRPRRAGTPGGRSPRPSANGGRSARQGRGLDDRPATAGRNCKGCGPQCAHSHYGRADVGFERTRSRSLVSCHCRSQSEGRRDRLYFTSARGIGQDWRLHHGSSRRPGHRKPSR